MPEPPQGTVAAKLGRPEPRRDAALIDAVVEAAPDAIVVTDETGRIVFVNRQTELLFGYERGELTGQAVEILVPDDLRDPHRTERARYEREPVPRPMGIGMVLVGKRSDGATFPVEISLSPLGLGDETFVIAAVRDISERMVAEAAAEEVRYVLDQVQDAVFIFDRSSWQFTYVNRGAVQETGYTPEELAGMTLVGLAPDLTREELANMLVALELREVSAWTLTTTLRHKSGSDAAVELVIQAPPPRPHTSDLPPFVAIARDVRERMEVEERLRAATLELATAQDRERIAQDLHDTVIQRIFAAGMAIQGSMGSVRDPRVAERLAAVVDDLDTTIRELRSAIFDLEGGRYWLGAVPPGEGVRSGVLSVVAESERALGFAPRVDFVGPVDDTGDGIRPHIVAAVREMLSNVARHARASAVTVEVGAFDGEVVARVLDDGVGPPPVPPIGNGLRNLTARAESLGGSFEMLRRPSGGTEARWTIPAG